MDSPGGSQAVDSPSSRNESTQTVRAYHFVPSFYGLDNLRKRRLKIAQFDDLNDPFELWAIAQPNKLLRRALKGFKETLSRDRGLLCFSRSWHNPLLWSHYADRHRGMALGFDVNSELLQKVSYVKTRRTLTTITSEIANWILFTKYEDWKYEDEIRMYATLDEPDLTSGLFFADFSEQLELREVIVGPLSAVTKTELHQALGKSRHGVSLIQARLAFRSFRVVKNKQGFKGEDVSSAKPRRRRRAYAPVRHSLP